MDSRKIKIARIIGVGFLVLGIGYWVASFFLPNTYTNERPSEDAVFSTKVVSVSYTHLTLPTNREV